MIYYMFLFNKLIIQNSINHLVVGKKSQEVSFSKFFVNSESQDFN